ncbi:hypothetical protein BVI2075_530043 [Burkholderia vietnamiensis]|nr:hypothetical protein BVI2075_530043 [Burkholderia vietnamiensis]
MIAKMDRKKFRRAYRKIAQTTYHSVGRHMIA